MSSSERLSIDVALAPGSARPGPETLCLVVDVARATSNLVAMFEAGAAGVLVVRDVAAAREAADGSPGRYVLAGERGGVPPPGFALGNSPWETAAADLRGREVAFSTTNGTAAIEACRHAGAVLTASFVNAAAALEEALRRASLSSWLIVCSGELGGFVLEDGACAGLLVERVMVRRPEAALSDAARAARRLWSSYRDPGEVVREAGAYARLAEKGLERDLDYCARLDASPVVPTLVRMGETTRWPLRLL